MPPFVLLRSFNGMLKLLAMMMEIVIKARQKFSASFNICEVVVYCFNLHEYLICLNSTIFFSTWNFKLKLCTSHHEYWKVQFTFDENSIKMCFDNLYSELKSGEIKHLHPLLLQLQRVQKEFFQYKNKLFWSTF